jgi:hypothetical protein
MNCKRPCITPSNLKIDAPTEEPLDPQGLMTLITLLTPCICLWREEE